METPDEVRPFRADTGHLELARSDAGPVGRAIFQPGWRWSEHVKPIAGTESCQAAHACYLVSGRMRVVMAPGHDAWIVGDEPCVVVDRQGSGDDAKRQREGITLAKVRGAYRGRRKALSPDQASELRKRAGNGEQKTSLARDFGISRETLYQYLRTDS
jgi:hypothetical protein